MKRLAIRLSALAGLAASGLFAAVYTQNPGDDSPSHAAILETSASAQQAAGRPEAKTLHPAATNWTSHVPDRMAERDPIARREEMIVRGNDDPHDRYGDPPNYADTPVQVNSRDDYDHRANDPAPVAETPANAAAGDYEHDRAAAMKEAENAAAVRSSGNNPYRNPYVEDADASRRTTAAAQPIEIDSSDDEMPRNAAVASPALAEPRKIESPVAADDYNNRDYNAAPAKLPTENRFAADSPSPSDASAKAVGIPGSATLEGLQAPSLSIQKSAPAEVQVGKPATFTIQVQNTGSAAARAVQIVDVLPRGTRLIAATPTATIAADGRMTWNVDSLKPGETTVVKIELLPVAEGAIGSVATVHFQAEASASTKATKPEVTISVSSTPQVMIGQQTTVAITVSNPGSGTASGVTIETDVPPQLKHPAGRELEFEVGSLAPNESRQLQLVLTAVEAGPIDMTIKAEGDSVAVAEQTVRLDVVAPQLTVALEGPQRRFLDRKATYKLTLDNPGTAAAKDVELVAFLPQGMKFVEANNQGTYDAQKHAVYWSLEELPEKMAGDVTLTAVPTEPGNQTLRVEGKASLGLAVTLEETVEVDGFESLAFQVVDKTDPVEIGGEGEYEIRISNSGSKSASNVQIIAQLPAELKPVSADGPTTFAISNERIVFQPLSRLAPGEEKVFTIRARALQAGDLRMSVSLKSDAMSRPVVKEESTRVFGDE